METDVLRTVEAGPATGADEQVILLHLAGKGAQTLHDGISLRTEGEHNRGESDCRTKRDTVLEEPLDTHIHCDAYTVVYTGVIGLEGSRPADTLRSRSSVVGVQGSRSTVDPTGIRHRGRDGIAISHGIAVDEIQLAAADGVEEAEAHGEFHFLTFDKLRTEDEVTGGKIGFDGICHFSQKQGPAALLRRPVRTRNNGYANR